MKVTSRRSRGMPEAEELKMIDGFFTAVFAEDTVTLRNWPEVHA